MMDGKIDQAQGKVDITEVTEVDSETETLTVREDKGATREPIRAATEDLIHPMIRGEVVHGQASSPVQGALQLTSF